jgi:hypothetical protein
VAAARWMGWGDWQVEVVMFDCYRSMKKLPHPQYATKTIVIGPTWLERGSQKKRIVFSGSDFWPNLPWRHSREFAARG